MATTKSSDFTGKDWTIEDSNSKFLLFGDRVEFAPAGKLVQVRVIRGKYTVALGMAKLSKGVLRASFVGVVGTDTKPFVNVDFELYTLAEKRRLRFRVTATYDGGEQPDQGGSTGGSGGSSSGGGNGTGDPGEGDSP